MSVTLLLSHSECRDIRVYALPHTICIRYHHNTATIATIQDEMSRVCEKGQLRSLGLHIQTRDRQLALSARDKANIDRRSLRAENSPVRRFFRWLLADRLADGGFIDFFLAQPLAAEEGGQSDIVPLIQGIYPRKKISIRFVNRAFSSDMPAYNRRIVELYWSPGQRGGISSAPSTSASIASFATARTTSATAGYERIRVVGKGAFGSAILYRRRDDDSLVVIKEINMHDLSTSERQLALNEVSLLSRLDHPSIVSYFDSFEEEGILMIEMEYADGGTLAQYLSRCDSLLSEQQILDFLRQMLSAVAYLHANNVLHRDLKTANIFLTRESNVKIGDFGISRIMGTETMAKGAETVVGTPYYISPEMCDGRAYNEKSDMWALGCVLYEMACLQKAFDGESLPALVGKIMKAEYEPVKGPYTSDLKMLIRELLQLDPQQRPTAKKALEMLEASSTRGKRGRDASAVASPPTSSSSVRSALYSFDVASISLQPLPGVPTRMRIAQIAIGDSHSLLLSDMPEAAVYAWGANGRGQLGVGDRADRPRPTRVRVLDDKSVRKIVVGNTFSVFLAERGTLLLCGDRLMSGCGKLSEDQLEPQLVNTILRQEIIDVAAGDEHVVAVAADGGVFVWGVGANGRLGTGRTTPIHAAYKLPLPSSRRIIGARAGPDATALLVADGALLAMGSNRHNKLSLALRNGFFAKEKAGSCEDVLTPTAIKAFPARVIDVSLGRCHMVLESGLVYVFGLNDHAELGIGTLQAPPIGVHVPVKSLLNKAAVGTRKAGEGALTIEDLEITGDFAVTHRRIVNEPSSSSRRWPLRPREKSCKRDRKSSVIEQIIPHPSLVLRLDSSSGGLRLAGLACHGRRVIVVVDTSVPSLASIATAVHPRLRRQHSAPLVADSTAGSELQTWLRKELDEADHIPVKHLYSDPAGSNLRRMDSSITDSAKLKKEIEELKREMKEQTSNFQGHEQQMTMLQTKLSALHARSAYLRASSPPPAYAAPPSAPVTPAASASSPPRKLPYNAFFPNVRPPGEAGASVPRSTTCRIF